MPGHRSVSIERLSKAYRERHARHTVLDDLDLDIEAGSIVAILGRSGSSMSTLLNLISGIDRPDSGYAESLQGRF